MLNILVKASLTATLLVSVTTNTYGNENSSQDNSIGLEAPATEYSSAEAVGFEVLSKQDLSEIDSIGCYDFPLCELGGD